MNKLLVITVLVALLALSAESFRVARQAEDAVEEQGTIEKITGTFKGYYDGSINTVSSWLDNLRGLKLEEKIKNIYDDTTRAIGTYSGIAQDQVYHIFYNSQ